MVLLPCIIGRNPDITVQDGHGLTARALINGAEAVVAFGCSAVRSDKRIGLPAISSVLFPPLTFGSFMKRFFVLLESCAFFVPPAPYHLLSKNLLFRKDATGSTSLCCVSEFNPDSWIVAFGVKVHHQRVTVESVCALSRALPVAMAFAAQGLEIGRYRTGHILKSNFYPGQFPVFRVVVIVEACLENEIPEHQVRTSMSRLTVAVPLSQEKLENPPAVTSSISGSAIGSMAWAGIKKNTDTKRKVRNVNHVLDIVHSPLARFLNTGK